MREKSFGVTYLLLLLLSLLLSLQAILDFAGIHWTFLWGILIAKSLVFMLTIMATLMMDHKHSNNVLGNAGLRGTCGSLLECIHPPSKKRLMFGELQQFLSHNPMILHLDYQSSNQCSSLYILPT